MLSVYNWLWLEILTLLLPDFISNFLSCPYISLLLLFMFPDAVILPSQGWHAIKAKNTHRLYLEMTKLQDF